MGDAADDARFQMEQSEEAYYLHELRQCEPDCPYCAIECEEKHDG